MYEVLPAIARKDVNGWMRGIQAFQECGFKRLEWELQPEICHDLRKAAVAAGASAVALSSMGPTMAVFAADTAHVAEALGRTLGTQVTLAEFSDVGVTLTIA